MSFEKPLETSADNEASQLGYSLFREGSVRRFNPSLFAIKGEDDKGWVLVELKEGRWVCDCNTNDPNHDVSHCPYVYAALLYSATYRAELEESSEIAEGKPMKCRYCGSMDISKVGFRYNARGIARRYICNECRRKFSVAYVEPQAAPGAPSGTLWLLSQVAMLTSKLNDLLRDLDERIASANHQRTDKALYETTSCTDTEEGATIL
jgi:transposase-like protein